MQIADVALSRPLNLEATAALRYSSAQPVTAHNPFVSTVAATPPKRATVRRTLRGYLENSRQSTKLVTTEIQRDFFLGTVVDSSHASTSVFENLRYFPIRMCGRGFTQLRRVLFVTHPRETCSIEASWSGVRMSCGVTGNSICV